MRRLTVSKPGSRRRSSGSSSAPTSCSASSRIRARAAPGAAYPVSDVELASRLSFFLWSSIPDDELLDRAVKGTLRNRGVLERQVRRMLGDPRAKALVENFASQWLQLRDLQERRPRSRSVPGVRREPARGVPARDRAVHRQPAAGRSRRPRAADRRLHVPQRAARAPLRRPGRLGQPLPARRR